MAAKTQNRRATRAKNEERRTTKEERRTEMAIKLIARERATIAKLALCKTLQVICGDIVYGGKRVAIGRKVVGVLIGWLSTLL